MIQSNHKLLINNNSSNNNNSSSNNNSSNNKINFNKLIRNDRIKNIVIFKQC